MSVDGPNSSSNTQFTPPASKESANLQEKDLITDKARIKGLTENEGAPIADNIIDMQRKRTKDGEIIKVTAKVAVNIKIGNKFLKQVVVLDVGDLDYYNKLKDKDKTGYIDKTRQLTHFVANLKMLIADGQNYKSLQEFQERVVGITPSGDPDKPPRHFLGASNGVYFLGRHHFNADNPIWQKYLDKGKWFFQSRAWSAVRGGVEIAHVNKSGHDLFSNQGLSRARFIDGAGHVAGQIITRKEFPNYANLKQGLSDEDLDLLYSKYVKLSTRYNTISATNIREQQKIQEHCKTEINKAPSVAEKESLKAQRDQEMANLNEENEIKLNKLYIGISILMGCKPNPMVLKDQQKLVKSQSASWFKPSQDSLIKEASAQCRINPGLVPDITYEDTFFSPYKGIDTLHSEIEAIASLLEWDPVSGIDSEGDIEAERQNNNTGLEFKRTDKAVEALGFTPKEGVEFARRSPFGRNLLLDVSTRDDPSLALEITTGSSDLEPDVTVLDPGVVTIPPR